jgi:hypothetical protein
VERHGRVPESVSVFDDRSVSVGRPHPRWRSWETLQRLQNAMPGSITQERQMGADLMAADQMMMQLNMQKRNPPMMPEGKAAQHRGRFTTYIKGILGPSGYQIPKWEKPGVWRPKAVEPEETVRIPAWRLSRRKSRSLLLLLLISFPTFLQQQQNQGLKLKQGPRG